MSEKFRHPHGTLVIEAGKAQLPALELIREGLVQAVIASERLDNLIPSIDLVRPGSGNDSDRLFLSGERARQPADQFERCVWGRFFVIRICEADHVPGILYQSMLKAPSSPNERPAFFTRKADRAQGSFHAAIRTARSAPYRVTPRQPGLGRNIIQ